MNDTMAETVENIRRQMAAAIPAVQATARAMVQILQPLVDWANTPEGRAQLAFREAFYDALDAIPDCHCLCQLAHPSRPGVCLGQHSAVTERLIQSPTLGDVWVPLCAPCSAG
jgi:hypothetical protein